MSYIIVRGGPIRYATKRAEADYMNTWSPFQREAWRFKTREEAVKTLWTYEGIYMSSWKPKVVRLKGYNSGLVDGTNQERKRIAAWFLAGGELTAWGDVRDKIRASTCAAVANAILGGEHLK